MKKYYYTLISIFIFFYSNATIINVPGDQPTIQAGINATINSDTVLVQPGTYVENINYNGKNITVASLFLTTQDTSYISQTIIDGNQNGSVVIFENEEDSTAMLCGFTITNGQAISGGGIYCSNSNPTIVNIAVQNNGTSDGYTQSGGGIYFSNSGSSLINVTVSDNTMDQQPYGGSSYGAGIYCINSSLNLEHVTIANNIITQGSYGGSGYGGGIYCENSVLTMYNVTIMENTGPEMPGGGICSINSDLSGQNLIIANNAATYGGGICSDNSTLVLQNAIISNNSANPYYTGILNGSDAHGGGISCINGSSFTLQNSTISNNSIGFVLSGGPFNGGGIYCSKSTPTLINVTISDNTTLHQFDHFWGNGGGICCINSTPTLQNVNILGNSAESGGGAYYDNSNANLENVTISDNYADSNGGGIYGTSSTLVFDNINRCNIYLNNAFQGKDLYSDTYLEVIVDTFTVLYPTDVYAKPVENYSFDILHGIVEQVDADLYVSPDGDNTNTGLTVNDPLKNFSYAFSIIRADSLHQNTIHLLEGTYSPTTTEEVFPINVPGYISLVGESESSVILDAEEQSIVFMIDLSAETLITDLTITGGNGSGITVSNCNPDLQNLMVSNNAGNGIYCNDGSSPYLSNVQISGNSGRGVSCENNSNPILENVTIADNSGGGMACSSSNPVLQYVTISGNSAESGGGISCDSANPYLVDVIITNNSATYGGAVYCAFNSSPNLVNVTITGNTAPAGGGIYCSTGSYPVLESGTITDNSASEGGGIYCSSSAPVFDSINRCNIFFNSAYWGNDLWSDTLLELVVDTFTVLYPTEFHAYLIENYTFDILHAKIIQEDADLYVSPEGDNSNSGLTANDPLKTIHYALSKIRTDSLNQNTIFLLEGTYSPSSNGEYFPVNMFNYVRISGVSESNVILDAEGLTRVIEFYDSQGAQISGLTVTGGLDYYNECGIYFYNSSPALENITIAGNGETGMYCINSSPSLDNATIANNAGDGVYCYDGSNPYFKNSQISDNLGRGIRCESGSNPILENVFITNNGGGMHCSQSSPTLMYVTISGNFVYGFWGGGYGGGIQCVDFSSPHLENVFITENYSSGWGGGIYCNSYSSPVLKNVQITGNTADDSGGGVSCNMYSNPVLVNVQITGNTAADDGGGIACYGNCNPTLINVTISDNSANSVGGAIYAYVTSSPLIVNSILWNNSPHEIFGNSINITYSDVKDGWEGEGNIDEDPLFTGSGYYPFALSDDSPCINAGNPDTSGLNLPEFDLAGNTRIYGGRIDMGAYENQSVSTFVTQYLPNDDIEFTCLPNPFSDGMTITWNLAESAYTKIDIYNSSGEKIKELSSEFLSEGKHVYNWKTNDLPQGVCFIRLQVGDEIITKKIIKF